MKEAEFLIYLSRVGLKVQLLIQIYINHNEDDLLIMLFAFLNIIPLLFIMNFKMGCNGRSLIPYIFG